MPHVPKSQIHAFKRRAAEITVDVDTDLEPADLSAVAFQFGDTTKPGLAPVVGGSGLIVDVSLTAADLDVAAGVYQWEFRAVIAGELRTLAAGVLRVDPEPTVP